MWEHFQQVKVISRCQDELIYAIPSQGETGVSNIGFVSALYLTAENGLPSLTRLR
jgi:hypothetical protein